MYHVFKIQNLHCCKQFKCNRCYGGHLENPMVHLAIILRLKSWFNRKVYIVNNKLKGWNLALVKYWEKIHLRLAFDNRLQNILYWHHFWFRIQNLGIRNQTGTLYFAFTHLRERQNWSTTKMSQIRQQSGQIYSSLIKLNPFVCRWNCLSMLMVVHTEQPHCTWLFSLKVATRI